MKINHYSASLKQRKTIPFGDFTEQLKTENKHQEIEAMRMVRAFSDGKLHKPYSEKIPYIGFSAAFCTRGRVERLECYNGVVLLEINRMSTRSEAEVLKKRLTDHPQIKLAFVGCSGLSLKFLVQFALPDNTLPQELDAAGLFHAHACRKALEFYRMQLDPRVSLPGDKLDVRCRFSFDPDPYINENPIAIRIEQPVALHYEPQWEKPLHEHRHNSKEKTHGLFFKSVEEQNTFYYASAMIQALKVKTDENKDPEIYRRDFLLAYMKQCFRGGIDEEQAIQNVLRYGRMSEYEAEVRNIFRAGYAMEKVFGGKCILPDFQKDLFTMEEFLERRYEMRINTINGQVEYREKLNYYIPFRTVTQQVLNTMVIHAQTEGLKVWDRDLRRHADSTLIPAYNPIERFLEELPAWDGKDYIRDLAAKVPCENTEVWISNFYTWFLGMVAGWKQMNKHHANSTLPLLIGEQACGKSTFCKRLLPQELQEYYTDSIDFSKKKEAMLSLTQYALINIDEFDSVSVSYQSFLKHVVQKAVVNVRKPYEKGNKAFRRYSSFIATCNNDDLLSDPTGSRRYLCVKITGTIDNDFQINYAQLYAQAIAALNSGEQYWFDTEHAKQTTLANEEFNIQSTEEQLLHHYFEEAPSEKEGIWMTPTEIYLYLRDQSKMKLGNRGMTAFGRVLKKAGFPTKRTNSSRYYLLRKK